MNTIFGYCGWDFGSLQNNKFQRGERVRISRYIIVQFFGLALGIY